MESCRRQGNREVAPLELSIAVQCHMSPREWKGYQLARIFDSDLILCSEFMYGIRLDIKYDSAGL